MGHGLGSLVHGVVVLVAAEEVEALLLVGTSGVEGKEVVTHLHTCGNGTRGHGLLGRGRVLGEALVVAGDEVGVGQVAIVERAARHPVVGVVAEVERADEYRSLHIVVNGVGGLLQGVAEGVARIAAEREAQAFHRIVVHAEGTCHGIGYLEFVGAARSTFHPFLAAEAVGVEACQKHGFVAPLAGTAPKADTRLVPRAGQDGVLALGSIDAEELGGQVVGIGHADGHHHVAQLDVELGAEGLLNPKLLEGHFTAALHFAFVLAAFVFLNLDGTLRAAMFELDFGTHGPALAEVVTQHDDYVGQVEASVRVVLVVLRAVVAQVVVTIKIVAVNGFPIAADSEAPLAGSGFGVGLLYSFDTCQLGPSVGLRPLRGCPLVGVKCSCTEHQAQ